MELMIALGLTLVLATAIFGAIRIHLQIASTGERKVRQAQLTRALLQKLQSDVASVTFSNPEVEEEATEEDTSSGLTLDSESTTNTSNSTTSTTQNTTTSTNQSATSLLEDSSANSLADAGTATTITSAKGGLIGDAQQLILYVSRPIHPSRLAASRDMSTESLVSDEKSISWFLNGSTGITAAGTTASSTNATGLARMEGDRFAVDYAEAQGGEEELGMLTRLIAPEVESLSFRYFDGTNWIDEWDSTVIGRLPQAIEVTFGLMLDDPSQARIVLGTREATELVYATHVIRIPRAEPFVDNLGL